jgi:hypothetical protein
MRIEIGTDLVWGETTWGTIRDVIVDPMRNRVTHLVVERGRGDAGRIVPIDAVSEPTPGEPLVIAPDRDPATFDAVEETDYIRHDRSPALGEGWDVVAPRYLALPYYPYLPQAVTIPQVPAPPVDAAGGTVTAPADSVPTGRSEIRRTSEVWSKDDHVVGRVDAFLVDDGYRVTHVVLERGHLWTHREICIPVAAVDQVHSDWIELSLTKDDVEALPDVDFNRG